MFKRKSKQVEVEEAKPSKRRRKCKLGRLLFLAITAGGAALALSPQLRDKALDKLFGSEEEFQYTPPTDAATENSGSTGSA
jgi:hypothetical protein